MTAELQAKLAERISREYFLSEDAAKKQAQEAVQHCPDLLQKNLEQWAAGDPRRRILRSHAPGTLAQPGFPRSNGGACGVSDR